MMIDGFQTAIADVNDQQICYSIGGNGPPVLLLHGFPQTHAMWHRVAPILAQEFTVVASDLRGYGHSSKPPGTTPYSFRHMGCDQHALMQHLGFEQYHLAGHDRGARVAHRLSLDFPDSLISLTVMDIVPTHFLLSTLSKQVATSYYHWFFLAQPYPFPESLIGHDPDTYFNSCLTGWGASKLQDYDPDALAAYQNCWRDPETIRGMCADYRAALEIDFELDATDLNKRFQRKACVFYGRDGAMAKEYDVPGSWRDRFPQMHEKAIPGGHFFIDQHPKETSSALLEFLQQAHTAFV
ncbi:MAG: alpha/beta hydrolase [Roseobacter sp.]